MYLTALTHRDRLFDLGVRWLHGRVEPDDGAFVTEVFLVDPFITGPVVARFLADVSGSDSGGDLRIEHLRTKDEVRRRIVAGCPRPTARALALFADYRSRPEGYFPTTPVDLILVRQANRELLAMVRFKHLMRIADKAARRSAAYVDQELRRQVRALGGVEPGESLHDLPTALLGEAERVVCQAFATGASAFPREEVRVDDVVGSKLVGEDGDLTRIETAIASHPDVLSVRRSEHRGNYNDVHFVVELPCPPPGPMIDGLLARDWSAAARRGLFPSALRRDIPRYVESGARSFFLELILTTWHELVESEFGRGLHEERIERQWHDPRGTGQLATNVALALMFLLLVAISPTVAVDECPVKLSGRYLPDMITGYLAQLFGLDIGRSPLWIPEIVTLPLERRGR